MTDTKIKLLIIDDDEVDRIAIKRAIKSSGFRAEIELLANYDQGLDAALNTDFDCIFVDYRLNGFSGLDLLTEYKKKGGASPVIVLSAHGDEKIAVEMMKAGACDYISKASLSPEAIAKSINYALKVKGSKNNASRIERALLETEQKLNVVISKSPLILFSLDESGVFTLFKGKAMENIRLHETDVIGKSVYEIWSLLPVRLQDVKRALLGEEFKEPIEFEGRFFEMHYIPSRDSDGQFTGVMGIATDITGHKEQEQELRGQIILSSETQKIKEQFLANMSHEIRTPIHGIISLSKIILQSKLEKEQLNYLTAIRKSADNLLVIINDILDFSKIEAEKMTFETTCFNLRELIQTIFELFKARFDEKAISLIVEMDPSLPQLVKGDPVRLSQVINNLVGNGVKFTHKGSVTLSVSSVGEKDNFTSIEFKVKDTGIGIPENKLATIFNSFSQAGTDITRKYGGTGLGLSIAKRIVELQEGHIKVESKLNEGTVFTFNMLFEKPAQGELETEEKKVAERHTDFKGTVRLLVVEDNDINRLIINKHIKDWGFKHEEACNGVEAVDMVSKNDYDVVLMDIEMPEMNGYMAAEKIRTTLPENKKHIPILAMTAHASLTEKDKCLAAGMNDYVSKPFDPTEVKNKIIDLARKVAENSDLDNSIIEHQLPKEVESVVAVVAETTAEAHAKTTTAKLTDLSFLREMSDDDAFIKEFVTLFLQNIPVSVTDLEEGLRDKDYEKIRMAAHKMKPSLNYVGLKNTYEIVAKIEKFAKEKSNLEDLPSMIKQVSDECNIACIELESDLKQVLA